MAGGKLLKYNIKVKQSKISELFQLFLTVGGDTPSERAAFIYRLGLLKNKRPNFFHLLGFPSSRPKALHAALAACAGNNRGAVL